MAPLSDEQREWFETSIENAMLKVVAKMQRYIDRRIARKIRAHHGACLAAGGKVQLSWGTMFKLVGVCMAVAAVLTAVASVAIGAEKVWTLITKLL